MEQEGEQNEVLDLSQALDEIERYPEEEQSFEQPEQDLRRVPGTYRFIIKLSHGAIKTEGQAKLVAVIIIIICNLITFSLVFKGKQTNTAPENIPTSATTGEAV